MTDLVAIRKRLDKSLAKRSIAAGTVKAEKIKLEQVKEHSQNALAAQELLQETSQAVQQIVHQRISDVVTKCLEAVFDDPYQFKIAFVKSRGKTDAKLLFVRRGHELDPLTESGGGVVDIAVLALRLACLSMIRPRLRKLLVLDEPMRGLSPQYHRLVPPLLETLAWEMGVQFVISTNVEAIACGKIVRL